MGSSIVDELVGWIQLRMSCEGKEKVRILPAARTDFSKQKVEDTATAAFGAKKEVFVQATRVVNGPFPVRDTFWSGRVKTADTEPEWFSDIEKLAEMFLAEEDADG